MRLGSLCSGVDGLALGVEVALGARTVWHSEIDPHASTILARHFDAPNLGDVRAVDWSTVEPVDLLVGGPPCQAVSQAGKRLGIADERWLWPEAFRAMAELRPRWCLWENPMGLLVGRPPDDEECDDAYGDLEPGDEGLGVASVDSGWFGLVLGEMAALGYVGQWGCLRSSDVGASHGRARVFLAAADPDSLGRQGAITGPRRHDGRGGGSAPDANGERREGGGFHDGRQGAREADHIGRGEPDRCGADVAVALLPTPRATDQQGPGRHGDGGPDLRPAVVTLDEGWIASLPDGRTIDYGPAVRRWETVYGEPAPAPRDDKGRLNPDLARWMLGFPSGWVDGIPRTAQLRCLGNSCQPQVAALAASLLLRPLIERAAV